MIAVLRRLLCSKRADEFAEAAIALPVVVFITIAFINLTMAGFASVNANNAANYAARVGSVNQQNPGPAAYSAALESINHAKIGEYQVGVSGGGFPGAQINVVVTWNVPNFMGGIASFFGASFGDDFTGTATSVFRQEGW